MKSILDRYLDRVLVYANKPESESEAIRQELKDHLLQKVEDLAAGGVSREEAVLDALRKHGSPKIIGYRLRGPFPWIDIRSQGTARGVIAIGPRAVGIFAFGGFAIGLVAFGAVALGLFSTGGFALGLLFVWGGFGIGGIVTAGIAIGAVAVGGVAIGAVAAGGKVIAAWAPYGSESVSHYAAKNVPPLLKSLAPLLGIAGCINRHFAICLPLFYLMLFSMMYLQYREGRRVRAKDDWLLDG